MSIFENSFKLLKKFKLGKSKFEINVHNIEYPESYYQPTKDLKEILLMFDDAVKNINKKYKAYSCEELFKNKFGEELSEVDFIYPERIEAYSQRNNVPIDLLKEFDSEIRPLREEVCKGIYEEITLHKCIALYKYGDNSNYILDQIAKYEMIYGNKDKAKMFKKMSDEIARRIKKEERNELINNIKNYMGNFFSKIIKTKTKEQPNIDHEKSYSSRVISDNKKRVLQGMIAVIEGDINPYGKEPEYQENWLRTFQMLNDELSKSGIDLNCEDNKDNDKLIGEAWAKICNQVKNEKSLTYYAKLVEEAQARKAEKSQPENEISHTTRTNSEPIRS